MWPFWILMGVPGVIAGVEYAQRRRTAHKAIITSFFLIFLLLLIFRSFQNGVDLPKYVHMYKETAKQSWEYVFTHLFQNENEAGYYLLSRIFGSFTKDFRWLMVFAAFVSIIPVWLLYRNSINGHYYLAISIFMCIGLFPIYFSALRQIMAIGLAVPAYYCTKNRKLLFFLLIVGIAMFFHKSAFVLLLMYPVYHIRLNWAYLLVGTILAFPLVYLFRVQIFSFLGSVFSSVYEVNITVTNAISIFLLLIALIVFSFSIADNTALDADSDTAGLRNLLILSGLLQIFAGIDMLAMRMNYYYLLFVPIVITRIIDYCDPKYKRLCEIAVLAMLVFFTVFYFVSAYNGANVLKVYPYIPFWRSNV